MPKFSPSELLPPGINPHNFAAVLLHSFAAIREQSQYISEQVAKRGPLFVGGSFFVPVVYGTNAQLAKELYGIEGIVPAADLVRNIAPSSFNLAIPPRHEQIKQEIQPALQAANIRRHTDYGLEIETLVHEMVTGFIREKQEPGDEIPVIPEVNTLTLRMMGHVLGIGNDSESTKFLREIINGFKIPLLWPILKNRIEKSQNTILSLINGGTITSGMFYDHFINNTALNFTQEELRDNFTALLLGGQSTTAHFLTMLLYNLSEHPNYALDVYKELSGKQVNVFDVDFDKAFPKTYAFMYEVLRMFSPFYYDIFRHPTKNIKLAGYDIPVGMPIFLVLPLIMHDPQIFHQPNDFRPERWNSRNRKSDLFAFGRAAYRCPGQDIAIASGRTLLITLANLGSMFGFDSKLSRNPLAIHFIEPANGMPIREIWEL